MSQSRYGNYMQDQSESNNQLAKSPAREKSPLRNRSRFNNCRVMRANIRAQPQCDTAVNLVKEEVIMNGCNTYVANNTMGMKIMILDPGALVSLAMRPWLDQYLKEFDLKIQNIVSSNCCQVFRLGGIN